MRFLECRIRSCELSYYVDDGGPKSGLWKMARVLRELCCGLGLRIEADFVEQVSEMICFGDQFDPGECPGGLDRNAAKNIAPLRRRRFPGP